MLFDGAEGQIGHLEVLLGVIIEAGEGADVTYGLYDDTVDREAEDNGSEC